MKAQNEQPHYQEEHSMRALFHLIPGGILHLVQKLPLPLLRLRAQEPPQILLRIEPFCNSDVLEKQQSICHLLLSPEPLIMLRESPLDGGRSNHRPKLWKLDLSIQIDDSFP